MAAFTDGNRLLVSASDNGGTAHSGMKLHAIAPVLLGLAAPVIVFSLASPAFLIHARFLIFVLLGALFLAATVLFAISLLSDGPLSTIIVDRDQRRLDLVHSGAVATKSRSINFADIALLRLTTQYDDDGYRFSAPELVLRDGTKMQLPIAMTEAEVKATRAAIGLVT